MICRHVTEKIAILLQPLFRVDGRVRLCKANQWVPMTRSGGVGGGLGVGQRRADQAGQGSAFMSVRERDGDQDRGHAERN